MGKGMVKIKKIIPGFMKPILRMILYFFQDLQSTIKGRDPLTPPPSMNFAGDGDFKKIGEEFKRLIIELGQLQPDERILDVGCGIGRVAIPLTSYISPKGEYWGFDIVKKGIIWCQDHISSRASNFHFLHCDVSNNTYNASGTIMAKDYKFPFNDGFFDFVFLTSVFTHMFPSDVEHYLSEISRVIKTGGRCLITFFIINDEAKQLMEKKASRFNFIHQGDGYLTVDKNHQENAIAFPLATIRSLFPKYNLEIREPIHFGSWCGRVHFLSGQDIVIAIKK